MDLHTTTRVFSPSMGFLSTSNTVPAHAPPIVRQLNLFLDEDGLICAKGRFALTSSLILLPQHSRFNDSLILDCHHCMHHISVGGTIVTLRNRFWVPAARVTARRLLCKCTQCQQVTGHHYTLPTSPELPQFRKDMSVCRFSNIGVDFTGHLIVNDRTGNHIKAYICLFTCLTTRAINLEIVEDFSMSSYLQAFPRHCRVLPPLNSSYTAILLTVFTDIMADIHVFLRC